MAIEPAGHVALRAFDGKVYSATDLGTVPHEHLDLSDLMNYNARCGMTLSCLGWTEDVAGYPLIADGGLAAQGPNRRRRRFMATLSEDEKKRWLAAGKSCRKRSPRN